MKILIVAYYELKEALFCAADSLEKYGHQVISFPLFQLMYDQHDKKPDYCLRLDQTIKQ